MSGVPLSLLGAVFFSFAVSYVIIPYFNRYMHAAGIVISEEPLWKYVPVCRGANDEIVTQYAKNEVEEAGLEFYTKMAEKATDTATKRVFKRLARDEEKPSPPSASGLNVTKRFPSRLPGVDCQVVARSRAPPDRRAGGRRSGRD